MSKHSPGPWVVEELLSSGSMVWGGTDLVAVVEPLGEAREANARLIAAAPQLLEVALAIVQELEASRLPRTGLAIYNTKELHASTVGRLLEAIQAATTEAP